MTAKAAIRRCAIYTRKSSEEGLEQEFNSLDAQREAASAYIKSQTGEGWREIADRYDDGGYSGGNLERPGLNRLLDDIRAGKVNVVVVYKVDRLTRSLSDFAKLIEVFEATGVSFVSVTQQFNTTTSMGRLMLNVLLSFAQFEREVTGERIRDKIAASKRKGMWMGGTPPIGYEVKNRKLVVVPADAAVVVDIYARYVRLGCVSKLARELRSEGVKTRYFTSTAGRTVGGRWFSRGHLHRILTNRIYIGEVIHRGESFPGDHSAIVNRELWDRVRLLLANNRTAVRRDERTSIPALLKGLIFDDVGNRMTPSQTGRDGRRHCYYVSQAVVQNRPETEGSVRRIPARDVDRVVAKAVLAALDLHATPRRRDADPDHRRDDESSIRKVIRKVVISQRSVAISITAPAEMDGGDDQSERNGIEEPAITFSVPLDLVEKGGVTRIVANGDAAALFGNPDSSLVKAIARAHSWKRQLLTGEVRSVKEIAQRIGVTGRYVSRILRFAFLAPDIVEAILDGRQPPSLSVERLREPIPYDWAEQRRTLGFRPR